MSKPTLIASSKLADAVGTRLGPSPWHSVNQSRVDGFAEATEDHQWIHLDAERAAETPFDGTVAHGYLTLSLAPALLDEIVTVEGSGMVINYGANKVRFPAPLPVGSRVRMSAELTSAEPAKDGSTQVVFALTFEAEGNDKPCCIAEIIFRYYPRTAQDANGSSKSRQPEVAAVAPLRPVAPSPQRWAPVPDPVGITAAWLRWLGGSYSLWATSMERSRNVKPGDLDSLMAPVAENAELAARFWAEALTTARSETNDKTSIERGQSAAPSSSSRV